MAGLEFGIGFAQFTEGTPGEHEACGTSAVVQTRGNGQIDRFRAIGRREPQFQNGRTARGSRIGQSGIERGAIGRIEKVRKEGTDQRIDGTPRQIGEGTRQLFHLAGAGDDDEDIGDRRQDRGEEVPHRLEFGILPFQPFLIVDQIGIGAVHGGQDVQPCVVRKGRRFGQLAGSEE